MKKRIWTNRISASALIALVGLGIGIGCSKDTGVSPDPQLRAEKPALPSSSSYHPQSGINYDPFAGMTWEDRKAALGGIEGGVKHLQVVAGRVAQAMQDKQVRALLHRTVPKEREGEVHLAEIMMNNPHFFGIVADGFKGAVSDKGVQANLSDIIRDAQTNGEAILKATKALLDVVMVVVTPPGKEWNGEDIIPVFSASVDDDVGSILQGVDGDLKPTSLTQQRGDVPYTFLFLNFDEDSPQMRRNRVSISFEEELTPIEQLWASLRNTLQSVSLTTPASAHVQGSGVVHTWAEA